LIGAKEMGEKYKLIKNQNFRNHICNRLLDIAEKSTGTNLIEIKKEIYKLKNKILSQNYYDFKNVDNKIIKLLNELNECINKKYISTAKDCLKQIDDLINECEYIEKEGNFMKIINNLKQLLGRFDNTELLNESENNRLKEYDKIKNLKIFLKTKVYEAAILKKNNPNDIQLSLLVANIDECILKIDSALSKANNLTQRITRLLKAIGTKEAIEQLKKETKITKFIEKQQYSITQVKKVVTDFLRIETKVDSTIDNTREVLDLRNNSRQIEDSHAYDLITEAINEIDNFNYNQTFSQNTKSAKTQKNFEEN